MSQDNLNGRQVLMPGANGITYDFSRTTIDNDDSWQFDVDELNIKEGSNSYGSLNVFGSNDNYISNEINANIITIGKNTVFYQDEISNKVITVQNGTNGKVWFNEELKTYYKYTNNTLYKSLNANEWDFVSSSTSFNDMEYDGNVFVGLNITTGSSYSYYKVFTSTDGINFTQISIGNLQPFARVYNFNYSNGLFYFAVYSANGTNARINVVYSNNGRSWTSDILYTYTSENALATYAYYDGSIFIANANTTYLKRNGGTWQSVSNIQTGFNQLFEIEALHLLFYPNSNTYYSIQDNNSLESYTLPVTDTWNDCVYFNNKYYLLGNIYILSTTDGINWNQEASDGPYLYMCRYTTINLDSNMIILGNNNIYYKDSIDNNVLLPNQINGKVWFNEETNLFYKYIDKTLYESSDTFNWIIVASNSAWIDLCYCNGVFYTATVANRYVTIYKSTDGITFEQLQRLTITSNYYLLQNTPEFRVNGNNISISMALSGTSSSYTRTRYCITVFSEDGGATWQFTNNVTLSNITASTTSLSVCDDSLMLVYYGDNNNNVYIYRDGTWTKITTISYGFNQLFNINNLPLLFYPNSNTYYSIQDDNSLESYTLPVTDTWNDCVYFNNKYYLLGNIYILSTTDGINWNQEASDGPYLYMGRFDKSFNSGIGILLSLKKYVQQNVSLIKTNNTYSLMINDAVVSTLVTDINLDLTGSNNILTSDLVNYFKSVKFSLNNDSAFEWNYSGDGTLYDATGNGNNATVTYNSTYSPNISITLSNFRPVNVNQNNEGSEEDGGSTSMIEPDEASITVIDTDSENWNRIPVFKELAKDLRNSDWPVDLVLSLVVVLIDMLLCFLIYRFTRNQLTSGIVALVLLGYFVIMGCIPLFALVAGVVAELAIMTKRKVISY